MHNCWLVMQFQEVNGKNEYCIQGIFDTQAAAEEECLTDQYTVIPMTMNRKVPHDLVPLPGQYFPRAPGW